MSSPRGKEVINMIYEYIIEAYIPNEAVVIDKRSQGKLEAFMIINADGTIDGIYDEVDAENYFKALANL